jgi:hypothetical protein
MTDDGNDARRYHDRIDEMRNTLDAAAIKTGGDAIRWVLLANGGAIAAVLSFLAALSGKSDVDPQGFLAVTTTLFWFAWAVLASLFAMLLAYLTNYFFGAREASRQKQWEHPYAQETVASTCFQRCGAITSILAFICGTAGVAFFAVGVMQLKCAVQGLFPIQEKHLKIIDPPKPSSPRSIEVPKREKVSN